jgi:hypothetical protein
MSEFLKSRLSVLLLLLAMPLAVLAVDMPLTDINGNKM